MAHNSNTMHSPAASMSSPTSLARLTRIEQARQAVLHERHALPSGAIAPWIERSWQRCMAMGLQPGHRVEFGVLTNEQMRRTARDNAALVQTARPVLDTLGRAIVNTRYFAILTNAQGVVVDVSGAIDRSDPRANLITRVGVDLSLKDLKITRERFEHFAEPDNDAKSFGLSSASALNLPFADNTFDKVICSEVLEHIPDYRGALREIERVLKPGGLFCASVPRRWPEKICWALSEGYYQVPGGHLRIFRSDELRSEIEFLGFTHYYRHWAHALHVPFWWLKCLFWQSQDTNWLIKQYHRLLVWDLMKNPALTRILEKSMNPIMGKSVVMYFRKQAAS